MRRLLLLFISCLVVFPAAVEAQPRLMLGGGFTAPQGELAELGEPGWHLGAGLQVTIPTLPVGLRADGRLHKLGADDAAFRDNEYLTGSLSLLFQLPGVGLEPYVLAGIGSYRYKGGLRAVPELTEFTNTGYHAGFGVAMGQLGFGLFAEVRYVHIGLEDGSTRLLPLTLGFRL